MLAEQIPLFDAGMESDGVEKIVVKPAPEASGSCAAHNCPAARCGCISKPRQASAVIWENVQLPFDHIQPLGR